MQFEKQSPGNASAARAARMQPDRSHRRIDEISGGRSRFQGDEYRVEAKAGVGSDSQLANLRWNIGEAGVQHFDAATPSTGIPGTEFGVPQKG